MSEREKLLEFADYKLARFGVPDFSIQHRRQPQVNTIFELLSGQLARNISACCRLDRRDPNGCRSSICPRCSTLQRMKLVINACKFQHVERLRASFFTCALKDLVADQGRLSVFSPGELSETIALACRDAWKNITTPIFAIGAHDLAFNEDPGNLLKTLTAAEKKLAHNWQIEQHIVIVGADPQTLGAKLKLQLLNGRRPVKSEFMVKPTFCTGRTIVYATKCQPIRKEAILDAVGDNDRQTRPLAKKPMAEALRWLSAASENERIFSFYQQGRTT